MASGVASVTVADWKDTFVLGQSEQQELKERQEEPGP